MERLHAGVVRDVAMALADARLREMVYGALKGSPFPENKLHFRTFIGADGGDLLTAMAARRGSTTNAVVAVLDSLIDLEFYMPVPKHLSTWTGGDDLIVAGALGDKDEPLVGYDLSGSPVTLSESQPPDTPALTLVPIETDFSVGRPARVPQASQTAPPGLYATRVLVYDDWEGWFNGQPEFEFHAYVEQPGTWTDVSCAGEQRGGTYHYWNYDNNGSFWYGDVLIATEGALAVGDSAAVQIWEDDTGPCTASGGRPPDSDLGTIQDVRALTGWVLGLLIASQGGFTRIEKLSLIASGLWTAIEMSNVIQDDDFVGLVSGPTAGCFPAAGAAYFQLVHKSQGVTGNVMLDERFAESLREPLCPPPPLSVSMSGHCRWSHRAVNSPTGRHAWPRG